ncbi:MAG: 4Fe-4S cluster-binding domain-containing protein [Ruminococcaceae bacterium]|nr:4Fe-4S cluster-binding domain-containing protein [Oscillospiraceae bacterium]
MSICQMCPRACGTDRTEGTLGFCRAPAEFLVSRVALHPFEEPCLCGKKGSGTIFLGGCNLGCVYCQNIAISRGQKGEKMTEDALEKAIFSLVEAGACNINFVTPTHYTLPLASLLEKIKPRLPLPVVWNCGGYESVEVLQALDGLVDIYLPDFKYHASSLAEKYSHAPDYPEIATAAIIEMFRQRGPVTFDSEGLMTSGVMVRHLVLPTCRKDSMDVLRTLASLLPASDIRLSLMSQYTPDFADKIAYPELARRVTSFEYNSVLDLALALGFEGYFQSRDSAQKYYTPNF